MATEAQIAIPGADQFEKPTVTALSVIERAILDPNLSADKLSVLLDVQLRYEANEARKKFEAAFELFKRNAPTILKTKHVAYPNKGGGQTDYWHAELDKITETLTEALLAVGIVQTWRTSDLAGKTTVTCILKGFGHTEEASTLSGPADTSGGKNSIQAIGSTVTYLQRYTLLNACGLAAEGKDNDGKTEGMSETAIDEFCIAMRDASSTPELQKIFKECWELSKSMGDRDAQTRLQKVYEGKKRELWEHKQ